MKNNKKDLAKNCVINKRYGIFASYSKIIVGSREYTMKFYNSLRKEKACEKDLTIVISLKMTTLLCLRMKFYDLVLVTLWYCE